MFDILSEGKNKHLSAYLISYYGKKEDEHEVVRIRKIASRFSNKVFAKLDNCNRHRERFLQKYGDWLLEAFNMEEIENEELDENQPGLDGRKKLPFGEISKRSQREELENYRKCLNPRGLVTLRHQV